MSDREGFVRPPQARHFGLELVQQTPAPDGAPNFDELFRGMPSLDPIRDLAKRRVDALNAPQTTKEAVLTPAERDLANHISQDVIDLSNRKWQARLDLEMRLTGLGPAKLDKLLPTINNALHPYDLRAAGVPDANEFVFGRLNQQTKKYEKPVFIDWQHKSQRA